MGATDTRDNANFGPLLRFWREAFALTQEALAEQVDVSPRHISRLENGLVTPSVAMVGRLGKALGLNDRDQRILLHSIKTPAAVTDSYVAPWFEATLEQLLEALMPAPAAVINVVTDELRVNAAWKEGFGAGGSDADSAIGRLGPFWLMLFEACEGQPPPGWELTRIGLLLSFKQMAILRSNAKISALASELLERYSFPDDWARLGSRFDPRVTFPVTVRSGSSLEHRNFMSLAVDEAGVLSVRESDWWLHVLSNSNT